MLPGTTEQLVVPTLEGRSGKKLSSELAVCVNPEFLREGSSLQDFYNPPFTLIGAEKDAAARQVSALYSGIDAPLFVTDFKTAEMVKYACNAFHGVKVSFANEVGNICKALGIDSHDVMRIFCHDTKLNLSSYYLKPGFAFGGSCLPKDLRAILYAARRVDVDTPVLSATLESNRRQMERALQMIMQTGKRRVGVLGLSFKAGTDDLREWPARGVGGDSWSERAMDLAIYDSEVSRARLLGANREYIEREIPHIWSLVRDDVGAVLSNSDVIVIGKQDAEFQTACNRLRPDQIVVDLIRLREDGDIADGRYMGICW